MRLANLKSASGKTGHLAFVDDKEDFYLVAEVATELDAAVEADLLVVESNRWLNPEVLASLIELDLKRSIERVKPTDKTLWRINPPVPNPGKIIAVGRNYMDHVREGQEIWAKRGKKIDIPTFPTAFAKFPSSLTGPFDPIQIPGGLNDLDYEVELAVIIGRDAVNVSEDDALGYVAGYTVCNDVATRGIQRREMEAQIGITLAKNFPGFAPMGPWITTSDSVGDPQQLQVTLEVDGDVRQDANTSDMIFPVAKLVSYWSQMGLETGDILITGTPSGVALAREEPEKYYLRAGQLVVARIQKLGELRNLML